MNTDALVTIAQAYAKHRSLTLSTVSTYAAIDGKFFRRLQDGSGCTLRKAHAVMLWFSENWPDDLEWPCSISRPPKREEAV